MANLGNFDAREVEPAAELEPLPAGRYLAIITESEQKPTKAGTGSFLELTFEVVEGPAKGRKVWSRLNLDSPSDMAVQIARSELSAVCRAVGVLQPRDSVELHNLPLVISVKQKPGPDGDIYNEIKGYSARKAASQQQDAALSSRGGL